MKHIKIRAFACEHEESVIYGTAVEYKMHRPTAENYSRSIHIIYVLRDDTEYAYVILSTYIWNNYAKTKHFQTLALWRAH